MPIMSSFISIDSSTDASPQLRSFGVALVFIDLPPRYSAAAAGQEEHGRGYEEVYY